MCARDKTIMCTRDSSISKASRVPYLQHAGDAGGRVKMCARDTQLRRFELNTTTTLLFKMYAEIIITIPPTQCAARMTCRQRRGRRGPGASERHQYNIKYNIISQHHFAKSCATRATPTKTARPPGPHGNMAHKALAKRTVHNMR